MKNGNQQGKRGTRYDIMKRAFRLLEYLRVNTDKKHPISQKELSGSNGISKYIPAPDTFNKFMQELTDILNSDESGIRSPEKWHLVYKGFDKVYGNECEELGDEETYKKLCSVTGIYYSHIFSDDELTAIINSLRTSKFAEKDAAERIIGKLKSELASKYYKEPLYIANTDEFTDSPELVNNLLTIQKAIGLKNKITFSFRYYNENGQPEPNKSKRHTVSPHYIVTNGGRFYLLGGYDNRKICVYRIDLMYEIHISKLDGKPVESMLTYRIHGMPKDGNELKRFIATHPYMSFETDTIKIELKALKVPRTERGKRLTHLIDIFGRDNCRLLENGNYEVECTEYDILMFALKECDDFEVVNPSEICEKIKEKIREIGKRYGA